MSTDHLPGSSFRRSDRQPDPTTNEVRASFAETALRLGGKTAEEARRTGAVDSADDHVDRMFDQGLGSAAGPVHQAVWRSRLPTDLFRVRKPADLRGHPTAVQSLDVVKKYRAEGKLYGRDGRLREELLRELGEAGYWGTLVDRHYGGSELTFAEFSLLITRMAAIEPTVAGLASVHGCIGAVDPLRSFGSETLKQKYLPQLAAGKRLSAFALTEPCAGSDLTALRTRAVREGNEFVITGEKLFITNAVYGRTIGLVCLLDQRPAVFIVDLPDEDTDTFALKSYGLYALRRAHNNGLIFREHRVPAENLLVPEYGDGLTIAYHGLNRGRVALCANAAGVMRSLLSEMLSWGSYRRTYGELIDRRELVQRRIGHLAGLITAADAMTAWGAQLLDDGFRGETECIAAKIFGSEALKEAAVELSMKTHGGRAFLSGHAFGDNIHDYLAPCIYEGEGEMLGMAFFKSMVKEHGKEFFEPIGKALHASDIRTPNLFNPKHLRLLAGPLFSYAMWYAGNRLTMRTHDRLPAVPRVLRDHAAWAIERLADSRWALSAAMRRYQLKLADRQCRMAALSAGIQDQVVVLVTALYAADHGDEVTLAAADTVCRYLRQRHHGRHLRDEDFRVATELGDRIVRSGWNALAGVPTTRPLMPYAQEDPV